MKYTNRSALGLELYFSRETGLPYDLPDSELEDIVSGATDFSRRILMRGVGRAFRQLEESHPEICENIPDDIKASMEQRGNEGSCAHLCRVVRWLGSLHTGNKNAYSARLGTINSIASGIDNGGASFRGFFSLSNQRVMLTSDDGSVTVTASEREWGQFSAVFEGAESFSGDSLPIPGYLFSLECPPNGEGGYHADFLIDGSFSGIEYPDRLLENDCWYECGFDFTSVHTSVRLYDYAGRMERMGTPRFEIVERCCSILVNKNEILGTDALSADERAFLPVACLLNGAGGLVNTPNGDDEYHCEQLIADGLSNRYAMRRFSTLLERCGVGTLAELLSKALENADCDNNDAAVKYAELLWVSLERCVANGLARPLLAGLCGELTAMTAAFSYDSKRMSIEKELLALINNAAQPTLERLGFTGEFPHFRRLRGNKMEYLSFMLDTACDKPRCGNIQYSASLAAATIPKKLCTRLDGMGAPSGESNALDCLPETSGFSKYGELPGGLADPGSIRLGINVFRSGAIPEDALHSIITDCVAAADRQFKWGSLPRRFRRLLRTSHSRRGAGIRSFIHCLPWGIGSSIALLLLWHFGFIPADIITLTAKQAVAAALAGGFLASLTVSSIRCFFCSKKLWRY